MFVAIVAKGRGRPCHERCAAFALPEAMCPLSQLSITKLHFHTLKLTYDSSFIH